MVEEDKGKISIQHLLQVGNPAKPHIVKHWRQDWLFENTDLYSYNANNTWTYKKLTADQVKGQWTQKVFQVDDSPRYQGNATWIFADGRQYWESTSDNPLPRREYTKRSDYNVMRRTNHHEILPTGWIHEQDNLKINRTDDADVVLVAEKGLNMYTKIEDEKCAAAKTWWQENQIFWNLVRAEWDTILTENKDLNIAHKRNNKALWKALTQLGKASQGKKEKKVTKDIHALIATYLTETATTKASAS